MNRAVCLSAVLFLSVVAQAQQSVPDDPEANPPVTKVDLKIVRRASKLLDSPSKWNRADNRKCPAGAKTLSIYCALEQATKELTGGFEHRGAAMQQSRFVIDDIAPNAKSYAHRLMDYNNDPTTKFSDLQKFFRLLEERLSKQLKEHESQPGEHSH